MAAAAEGRVTLSVYFTGGSFFNGERISSVNIEGENMRSLVKGRINPYIPSNSSQQLPLFAYKKTAEGVLDPSTEKQLSTPSMSITLAAARSLQLSVNSHSDDSRIFPVRTSGNIPSFEEGKEYEIRIKNRENCFEAIYQETESQLEEEDKIFFDAIYKDRKRRFENPEEGNNPAVEKLKRDFVERAMQTGNYMSGWSR